MNRLLLSLIFIQLSFTIILQGNAKERKYLKSTAISFCFKHNSSEIEKKACKFIDGHISKFIKADFITITGFTDNTGSTEYNYNLAMQRALRVKEYLISKGVSKDKIECVSAGESRTFKPNTTEKNKRVNRRVEIRFK